MCDVVDLLEQRLLACYQKQAIQYARALQILEERAQARKDGSDEPNWPSTLQDLLQTVAELDARLADDKVAWRKSGRTPGADLRLILDRLAKQIKSLGELIDGHVAELVSRKQRLLPEMDEFIRRRSMLNAYAQFGNLAKT